MDLASQPAQPLDFTPFLDQVRRNTDLSNLMLQDARIVVCLGSRALLAAFLGWTLNPDHILGAATTQDEGLALVEQHQPTMVLLSDQLERGHGVALVQQIKARWPQVHTLLLITQEQRHRQIKAAIDACCDGLLVESRMGLGAGFCQQARNFADGLRLPGHFGQIAGPGFPLAGGDVGLGSVVYHQFERRVARGQCQQARQVKGFDQRVQHQAQIAHGLQCGRQCRLQNPVGVGDVLQHRPQALEFGAGGQRADAGRRVGRQQIDPAHHAEYRRLLLRLRQQPLGFSFCGRRLHQHAGLDAMRRGLGLPVGDRHVPVNLRQGRREPAVVATGQQPAVKVCVDHAALSGTCASAGNKPACRSACQKAGAIGCCIMETASCHSR